MRNCIIRLESDSEPAQKEISSTMILFSNDSEFYQDKRNIHFFNIPSQSSNSENEIDSHFNLSEEKPLVSESEPGAGKFSTFRSSSEIKNNFLSKADSLIDSMDKIEGSEDEDFIIKVSPETDENTSQFYDEQSKLRLSVTGESLNLSDDKVKVDSSSLPWDFGRKFFERKIDYPEKDKFDTQHEELANENNEVLDQEEDKIIEESVRDNLDKFSLSDDEDNNKKVDEISIKSESTDEKEEDKFGNFKRVKTFVSSEMRESKKQGDIKKVSSKNEIEDKQPVKKLEDDFTQVKAKYEAYQLISNKKKKKKRLPFERTKKSISLSESKARYEYYRQKKKVLPFVVPFLIIIVLFSALYFFIEQDSFLSSEPENMVFKVTPPPHVNVIERDFEFAVTFPYAKSETNGGISGIEPSVFNTETQPIEKVPVPEKPKEELTPKKTPEVEKPNNIVTTENNSKTKVEQKEVSTSTTLNKNISKYKDYYVVQVAAYKTYDAAEIEAEKFRNQGYNAFIEIAELPGRGTWYRIKVGDFTSEKHAENFLIKNRK